MLRCTISISLALTLLAGLLCAQFIPGPSLPLDPPDLLVVVLDDVGKWDLEEVEVPKCPVGGGAGRNSAGGMWKGLCAAERSTPIADPVKEAELRLILAGI